MRHVRRGLCALLLLGAMASQADAASVTAVPTCTERFTVHDYKRYASRVHRRSNISHAAAAREQAMRRCQINPIKLKVVNRLHHTYLSRRRARARAAREYNVGYVLPWRIVRCESGGNWRAVNYRNPNRPAGAYQIITSTWLANGGGAYARTADQATPRQQNIVVARIWRGGAGAGQWQCS